jgi:hypothetical protein
MKAGDRIIVFSDRCSWKGQRGTVIEPRPLWVKIDGDDQPIAMSLSEVCVIPEPSPGVEGWAE